jgi:hypothetical protein
MANGPPLLGLSERMLGRLHPERGRAVHALGHGPQRAQRSCEQAFGPDSMMNSKVYEFCFIISEVNCNEF